MKTLTIIRNTHPHFRYALYASTGEFLGNLSKISDATTHYRQDIKSKDICIKRDFSRVHKHDEPTEVEKRLTQILKVY